MTDTILFNGRISTLDPAHPAAAAVAIKDGLISAVGNDRDIMAVRAPKTRLIDLRGRTVIPGLNDSPRRSEPVCSLPEEPDHRGRLLHIAAIGAGAFSLDAYTLEG